MECLDVNLIKSSRLNEQGASNQNHLRQRILFEAEIEVVLSPVYLFGVNTHLERSSAREPNNPIIQLREILIWRTKSRTKNPLALSLFWISIFC